MTTVLTLIGRLKKAIISDNAINDIIFSDIIELDISENKLSKMPLWINKCSRLQKLSCNSNELTSLPENLPHSLQVLDCEGNQLKSLPENLPHSLQVLYCDQNKLRSLPENLPHSLQVLNCVTNQLKSLPENLPHSLQELYCRENKLQSLPENLPHSLQVLNCWGNKLKSLPENLPHSLQVLNCWENELQSLPENLPHSLQVLKCWENQLKSLPISIIQCRNLIDLNFDSNPIEYIVPVIQRFLDRQKNHKLSVYNDSQSVHNHNVQESVCRSIFNVLKNKIVLTEKIMMEQIFSDNILEDQVKTALLEYNADTTEHSVLTGVTFRDLLLPVWQRIQNHTDKNEIKKILNQEMLDGLCKCFTGRLSRLVNCLNGFYDDITIKIGNSEQIGNIIVIIKQQLDNAGEYTAEQHRKLVTKELQERNYSNDIIQEWISFI